MEKLMDTTILEGKWKEIRGKAKVWWSKLTEKDLDRIAGKFDLLVGVLQEKYGFSRRRAVQEVRLRVIDYQSEVRRRRSRSRYE
jgi:uncharacterized protein YjbJ (UPF0337 family)